MCVLVQGWAGNFLKDERQAKNTIHYRPLQAISFPTALLSETILFIDGKINHLREGDTDKRNEWRICTKQMSKQQTKACGNLESGFY